MALYTYKKAPIRIQNKADRDYVEIHSSQGKKRLTIGELFSGAFHDLNNLIISSRIAGFFVPLILIVIGFIVIYKQIWPDIDQTLRQWAGYYNTESVELVAGDYIERSKYLSDPGSGYFKELAASASDTGNLVTDPVSAAYKTQFSLSIDSLGIYGLPVAPNIDSSNDQVYTAALSKGLGHFKGTSLPISEVNQNIVIYGHSASGDYYERTHDPIAAFSLLNKIKIGAIITIDIGGRSYDFRVVKSKVVQPNDISIIIGTPGRRTLTLFTCFPNGNNAQRFVVVANPI
jgi:LPXTG-site transpeptidase (sortase) family protein